MPDEIEVTRGVPFLPKDLRPEGGGPGDSWRGRVNRKKRDSK